jgi:hypothetical protein
MPTSEPAASDVAAWMLEKLKRDGCLYQADAAGHIQRKFGESFVYHNEAGNLAIAERALVAFRKLTPEDIVWDRAQRMWRKRVKTDGKGRQI